MNNVIKIIKYYDLFDELINLFNEIKNEYQEEFDKDQL